MTNDKQETPDPLLGMEEVVKHGFNDFYNQGIDHCIEIIKGYQGRDEVFVPVLNQIIKTITQLKKP